MEEASAQGVFCACGRKAVLSTTKKGPNAGKSFYTCPLFKNGCKFFRWARPDEASAKNSTEDVADKKTSVTPTKRPREEKTFTPVKFAKKPRDWRKAPRPVLQLAPAKLSQQHSDDEKPENIAAPKFQLKLKRKSGDYNTTTSTTTASSSAATKTSASDSELEISDDEITSAAAFNRIPKCLHQNQCVLRKVVNSKENLGRYYWSCKLPKNDGKCNFFKWCDDPEQFRALLDKPNVFTQEIAEAKPKAMIASSNSSSIECPVVIASFQACTGEKPEDGDRIQMKLSSPNIKKKDKENGGYDETEVFERVLTLLQKEIEEKTKSPLGLTKESAKISFYPFSMYNNVINALSRISDRETSLRIEMRPIPPFVMSILTNEKYKFDYAKSEKQVQWSKLPKSLVKSLMPFQKQSIAYAISREGRVIIGDEMGLGKTIQAIAIACNYLTDWPLLIICPSSLRENWRKEFGKWMPTLKPSQDIQIVESSKAELSCLVTIISYDLLARETMLTKVEKQKFKIIICDESHFLKGDSTKRTKAITPLIRSADRAILLSGTVTPSRPIELYSQLKALLNLKVMTKRDYGQRYCNLKQTAYGVDYTGAANLQELNLILHRLAMIRRLKQDVLGELPPKKRQQIYLTIKQPDLEILDEFKKKNAKKRESSTEEKRGTEMELYGISGTVKAPYVCQYLRENCIKNKEKFLVFAHHQDVLDALENELRKSKVGYIRIDGETPQDERQTLTDRFQEEEDILAAVLSITVAGTGLNFLPCSIAIFAELTWSPGTLLQAEDRIHRIGQKAKFVDIRYLIAKKTIDDKMWAMINKKFNVVEETLDRKGGQGESEKGWKFENKLNYEEVRNQPTLEKYFQKSSLSQLQTAAALSAGNTAVKNEGPSILDDDFPMLDDDIEEQPKPSKPSSDETTSTLLDDTDFSMYSQTNSAIKSQPVQPEPSKPKPTVILDSLDEEDSQLEKELEEIEASIERNKTKKPESKQQPQASSSSVTSKPAKKTKTTKEAPPKQSNTLDKYFGK